MARVVTGDGCSRSLHCEDTATGTPEEFGCDGEVMEKVDTCDGNGSHFRRFTAGNGSDNVSLLPSINISAFVFLAVVCKEAVSGAVADITDVACDGS